MGKNNTKSVAELDAQMDAIEATLDRLLAALGAPAKTKPAKAAKVKTAKAAKAKVTARKTPNRKPVANGTVAGHRCLVQDNRLKFIADHDWAQDHTSTSDLARAVIAGAPLVGSWALGPKTVARLTGVESAEPITRESQGGKAPKAPKAKKGKKAKKADVIRTAADGSHWLGKARVTAQGKPMTEAQIARADAPRDALGRTTPKREWEVREQLAARGDLERFEIEAAVAKAYAEGLI